MTLISSFLRIGFHFWLLLWWLSKKRSGIQTFFSTTVQPFMPHFRIWVFLNRVLGTGYTRTD
jgi:hypothetical protein